MMTTQPQEHIELGDTQQAFSRGGNRYCFIDPRDRNRCIKTLRPDRLPHIKRREKGFPKCFKPLSSFDDNHSELTVYRTIQSSIGDAAFDLIPRCYGMVETEHGQGLCTQLIRDDDGSIAITLKQYIWQHGKTEALMKALDTFASRWIELGMPSRQLIVHNIVVQCRDNIPQRLWVIDGLGWPDIVPLAYWVPSLARKKAKRRIQALHKAMDVTLDRKKHNNEFGYHGWLNRKNRNQ